MRTGAEYRESLRDGRKVWVLGEGRVDDVTAHPATKAMVDYYVAWYDRHLEPDWQDTLLTPPDAKGQRTPVCFILPKTADDLRAMGRSYAATIALSAGNVTHTPAYGNLISLGVLDGVDRRNLSAENLDVAKRYRDYIAKTGRFLTFSTGGTTIGYRFRQNPEDRVPVRLVKETDAGVIVRGKVGMHTALPFANEVYVGQNGPLTIDNNRYTFVVDVGSPGVTVVCRKMAVRHTNPFIAPLSSRFDELDAQMWLDDVLVPWEKVFLTEPPPGEYVPPEYDGHRGESIATWLWWHQLYCWLMKGEFTLGLALACTDAMGLKEHQPTVDYLVDMVVDVQTVRSCIVAAELDPEMTHCGYAAPRPSHVAAGSLAMLKARQRLTETLRSLPGSSLVIAPADTDLADPAMSDGLEQTFGGGGYTALQRSALLNMAWDHIASGLDGRESAFELYANGGIPVWRTRLRGWFESYNGLANAVLRHLDIDMPEIDVSSISRVAFGQRRPVSMPAQPPAGSLAPTRRRASPGAGRRGANGR